MKSGEGQGREKKNISVGKLTVWNRNGDKNEQKILERGRIKKWVDW